jgi:hypothetical protein
VKVWKIALFVDPYFKNQILKKRTTWRNSIYVAMFRRCDGGHTAMCGRHIARNNLAEAEPGNKQGPGDERKYVNGCVSAAAG